MDEILKELMGESYKENMTSEEVQSFFKNQVLGSGTYVNKEASEAEKRKLQGIIDAKDAELKNKMTDEEKKAAADQELQNQIEELKKQLLEGKLNSSQLKALSTTAKARLNAGVEDDDKDFREFINNISSEDDAKTSKIADYVNSLVEKAYNKGKTDAVKTNLGKMGNFKDGSGESSDGKTESELRAERLAKLSQATKKENSYFK